MQKSKDQGVGAAFGGGMTETVFGAGTTTALVRMTIWCACILLSTSLVLAVLHSRRTGAAESIMQEAVEPSATSGPASQVPAPPAAPADLPSSAEAPAAPATAAEPPAEPAPVAPQDEGGA